MLALSIRFAPQATFTLALEKHLWATKPRRIPHGEYVRGGKGKHLTYLQPH
jgi:hypothetical protein